VAATALTTDGSIISVWEFTLEAPASARPQQPEIEMSEWRWRRFDA
jgi:hypothetical protein